MNANELADGILAIEERIFLTKKEHQLFQNSATMLRQQQAEIEALKAAKIRAYNNGVEDGRKPDTNNKPVAWMETYKGEPNNLDWDKSNLNYGSEFHDVIPLYTHPVKAITDERITAIAKEFKDVDYTLDEEEAFDVFNHRGFARAILRKAQDK